MKKHQTKNEDISSEHYEQYSAGFDDSQIITRMSYRRVHNAKLTTVVSNDAASSTDDAYLWESLHKLDEIRKDIYLMDFDDETRNRTDPYEYYKRLRYELKRLDEELEKKQPLRKRKQHETTKPK